MYVIIDNYDSFTYNLFQYLSEITDEPIKVYRNDQITPTRLDPAELKGIIISPGPGRPQDAGVSVDVIRYFAGKVPILGVCLGHQSIGFAYGAKIIIALRIVHGKTESINHDGRGLFRNLPSPIVATRYHSLIVDPDTIPEELEITATSQDGEIMGLRHKKLEIEGVQFHPESIGSPLGKRILQNFIRYNREPFPAKEMLTKIIDGNDLTFSEMEGFMEALTDGNLNNSQIAGFLIGLNAKGFTSEEIAGAASVLRKKGRTIQFGKPLLDTCGTGGDGLGTFNISSMSALVAAACGVKVAKHGNRAVSSKSGSADFYKHIGIAIELPPQPAAELLDKTGFTFLFAPLYHPAMRFAGPVRRELGIKTIMNLIGPLSSPARVQYQLVGVFSKDMCRPVAEAAKLLGTEKIMVVHGADGQDEVSITGDTFIVEIDKKGVLKEYIFNPAEIGIELQSMEDLIIGTPEENVQEAWALMAGSRRKAVQEAVLLNSGAALYVSGSAEDLKSGYEIAREALQSGGVKEKVEEIVRCSRSLEET